MMYRIKPGLSNGVVRNCFCWNGELSNGTHGSIMANVGEPFTFDLDHVDKMNERYFYRMTCKGLSVIGFIHGVYDLNEDPTIERIEEEEVI